MSLLEFPLWEEYPEGPKVCYVNPDEVSSAVEYTTRRAYAGYNDVTDLYMKNGERHTVAGHVAKRLTGIKT